MKFAYNDEQLALQDALKSYFGSNVSKQLVRNCFENEDISKRGIKFELYENLRNELGLTSLIVDEQFGGYGASDLELSIALEQHGYYLVPSPLRTHSNATILVTECASEEEKAKLLPILSTGEEIATVVTESQSNINLDKSTNTIDGEISKVVFGNASKYLFFVHDGELIQVDLEQKNIHREFQPSIDPTLPLTKLLFQNSEFKIISKSNIAKKYETAIARMTILLCSEMVGGANASFDMALEYSKERKQFGRTIGSFQSTKHKFAQMLLELESAKSVTQYGAWLSSIQGTTKQDEYSTDSHDDELVHVASMAKYYVTKMFSHIVGENIQIQGGIGFTYEHDAHIYFKRASFNAVELGSASEHSKVLAKRIFS